MIELEFHISPACNSSRPQTGVGTDGTRSSSRWRNGRIVGQAARALDGLAEVGDDPVAPTPDLVAEDAPARCPTGPDRALRDHASPVAVPVRDRGLLDHESTVRHVHFERRVIKVAAAAAVNGRVTSLVDAPVQPDEVAACAERQPVEVDARGHGLRRISTVGPQRCSVSTFVTLGPSPTPETSTDDLVFAGIRE